MITIRKFKEDDVKKISKLTVDCLEKVNSKDMNNSELNFGKQYYSESGLLSISKLFNIFVCEKNGEIIGSIAHNKNKIHNFFVSPEYHKQGIGIQMLEFIEEIIAKDFNKIVLDSSPYAVEFYKKFGYKVAKVSKNEFGTFVEMLKVI